MAALADEHKQEENPVLPISAIFPSSIFAESFNGPCGERIIAKSEWKSCGNCCFSSSILSPLHFYTPVSVSKVQGQKLDRVKFRSIPHLNTPDVNPWFVACREGKMYLYTWSPQSGLQSVQGTDQNTTSGVYF